MRVQPAVREVITLPARIVTWAPAAVVYAAILAASSLPGDALAGTPGWVSVAGHASEYALLAVAIHRAVRGRSAGLVAVSSCVVLGVVNELQQGLVPGRFPDVADVGVDGLGALGAVLLLAATRRRGGPWR